MLSKLLYQFNHTFLSLWYACTEDDGRCTVHLINRGVVVIGKSVTVEFATTGPVSSLICQLDQMNIDNCELY